MQMRFLPRVTAIGVLALLVAFGPTVVFAAPWVVEQDRTDNGYSFTYDATEGKIGDAASSIRIDRRDPVSFVIYVRENKHSDEVGERLRTRLSVGLSRDRTVRYDGTFSFEITDRAGSVVYTDSRELKIVLRPKPGERKEALSFVFDLPSGTYDATGYFETDA
jgi:hypothetical protein